ncbi:MAG: DUF433 domain-containing protein [Thiohalocapsa sp.]|uniref:DUF433 domain-containing protein n=1 Tax=Thiohalocapsa sp. TaxID=2497641 RepID=UPI0025DDC02C|nr:DUF433 domain-containing protein [Thiohalocapsa sp.]MCG6941295.1 DUF433 domain-containing protein [Thiohalocapsa sp.]
MLTLLRERRFLVLEGPPGTGKTRLAWRLADRIGAATRIQFHPARTYEDFVVGLFPRPIATGPAFEVRPGDLLRANQAATDREHVLVIDEINRADLGRVLGEAILLFESGEEHREVRLPHTPEGYPSRLTLHPNLRVVATRNTADRSIARMDLAIRRRFAFLDVWPRLDRDQGRHRLPSWPSRAADAGAAHWCRAAPVSDDAARRRGIHGCAALPLARARRGAERHRLRAGTEHWRRAHGAGVGPLGAHLVAGGPGTYAAGGTAPTSQARVRRTSLLETPPALLGSNGDDDMTYPDLDRITVDPAKMGGKPCIRGIRITVGAITGLLASGERIESVLEHYPDLEREDIYAALAYASWRAEEYDLPLKAG